MISDLFIRKKLGVPNISLILIACCLIVSVPTYFSPRLYYVFGASMFGTQPAYFWQNYITSHFEHGSFFVEAQITQGVPLLVHLISNIAVVGLFGSIVERLLGTTKFLLLSVIAALSSVAASIAINSFGNGVSGIAWSYGPVVFVIIIKLYKHDRKRLLKDLMFYISILLFFMMWVFISVMGGWTTNYYHLISTLVGIGFVIVNKNVINIRLKELVGESMEILSNKRIVICSLVLPLFLLVVLGLSLSGVI